MSVYVKKYFSLCSHELIYENNDLIKYKLIKKDEAKHSHFHLRKFLDKTRKSENSFRKVLTKNNFSNIGGLLKQFFRSISEKEKKAKEGKNEISPQNNVKSK